MGNYCISNSRKKIIFEEILNYIPGVKYDNWNASRDVVSFTLETMWNNTTYILDLDCKVLPPMLYNYIPYKYKKMFHC